MQLTVPEAALLLGVSEEIVYQWIRNDGLPASRLSDRYRINRTRLFEWAHKQNLPLAIEGSMQEPLLENAIRDGEIIREAEAKDIGELIALLAPRICALTGGEPEYVLDLMQSRKNGGWYAPVPGMLAPEARAPIVTRKESAKIFVIFMKQPFQFGPKNEPGIEVVFTIAAPAARSHLDLLSRLQFCLRDSEFESLIRARSDKATLLRRLRTFSEVYELNAQRERYDEEMGEG